MKLFLALVLGFIGITAPELEFENALKVLKLSLVEQTKRIILTVRSSVQCSMCVQTIEKGLLQEAGVEKVTVDLKKKTIRVEYDPEQTDNEKIKLAITRLGYDADDFPANPKAYEALPLCCKKP